MNKNLKLYHFLSDLRFTPQGERRNRSPQHLKLTPEAKRRLSRSLAVEYEFYHFCLRRFKDQVKATLGKELPDLTVPTPSPTPASTSEAPVSTTTTEEKHKDDLRT